MDGGTALRFVAALERTMAAHHHTIAAAQERVE